MLDVASFVMEEWSAHDHDSKFPRERVFGAQVGQVVNHSGVNHVAFISEKASLQGLISTFRKKRFHGRLHRLAVIGESGKVVNVVSQSDVLRFAGHHLNLLPLKDTPLKDLKGLTRSPVMIRVDTPFDEALRQLISHSTGKLS